MRLHKLRQESTALKMIDVGVKPRPADRRCIYITTSLCNTVANSGMQGVVHRTRLPIGGVAGGTVRGRTTLLIPSVIQVSPPSSLGRSVILTAGQSAFQMATFLSCPLSSVKEYWSRDSSIV